jgi:DNA-directed RNA polymerase subunit N (RpoN/RPB10)
MTDIVSCCKECGNPLVGLVYDAYIVEIKKLTKSNDGTINEFLRGNTFTTFTDDNPNKYSDLLDSFNIYKHCCRLRMMSFFKV